MPIFTNLNQWRESGFKPGHVYRFFQKEQQIYMDGSPVFYSYLYEKDNCVYVFFNEEGDFNHHKQKINSRESTYALFTHVRKAPESSEHDDFFFLYNDRFYCRSRFLFDQEFFKIFSIEEIK